MEDDTTPRIPDPSTYPAFVEWVERLPPPDLEDFLPIIWLIDHDSCHTLDDPDE